VRLRYWITGGAFVSISIAAACALDDVDFSNKECPCGVGFVCDSVKKICVLPENVTPATEAGPVGDGSEISCTGETCPCNADTDCKESGRPRCGPAKVCVECLTAADNCPAGSFCNEKFQCTLGCKTSDDCKISPLSPKCNTTKHQCVECLGPGDCAGAKPLCSPSGICVEGCDLDAGKSCDGGLECCVGFCTDTRIEKENCGGCGIVCSNLNGTGSCSNKACVFACSQNYLHCQTGNTGCETPKDLQHCNSCTKNCTSLVVNAQGVSCNQATGTCFFTGACNTGFDNCNGNLTDGCECTCGNLGERCCGGPTGTCLNNLTCKPPAPNTCKN
jgi:hypothetical protein